MLADTLTLEISVRLAAPTLLFLTVLLPAASVVSYVIGAPRFALAFAVLAAACGLGRLVLSAFR